MEQEIIHQIYQTYGKENIKNLHVEQNDDYRGDYLVWFDVLDDDHWSEHIHYVNKDNIKFV